MKAMSVPRLRRFASESSWIDDVSTIGSGVSGTSSVGRRCIEIEPVVSVPPLETQLDRRRLPRIGLQREGAVAHRIGRFRRDQAIAVEPRRDHGDVVRPAVLVRAVDQPLAADIEILLLGDDARDLVRAHLPAQAVAAEHEGSPRRSCWR